YIISAMAGGLFFIVFVKIIWSKIYNPAPVFGLSDGSNTTQLNALNGSTCSISSRRLPGPEMQNLSLIASIGAGLLTIYLILKIIDLFLLGNFVELLSGSAESLLYIFELGIGVIIPLAIIIFPQTRKRPVPIGVASFAASFGLVFNRLNVGIFGYATDAGTVYFPSLSEWALGIGVIAAAGLVFMALGENIAIFDNRPSKGVVSYLIRKNFGSVRETWNVVMSDSLHRVSLLGVFVLPLAFIFLYPPYQSDNSKPVLTSIGIDAQRSILKIDGDRNGFMTLFNHMDHQKRLGDTSSCVQCHHISLPNDHSTPCSQCHQKMLTATNIFDHEKHKSMVAEDKQLMGINPSNHSCKECHQSESPKTNQATKDCLECHKEDMFLTGKSTILLTSKNAVSFADAMHLTCMECHKKEAAIRQDKHLDKCYTCHKSLMKSHDNKIAKIASK
ncbi:MAG: hypothetical protein GY865_18455, partial [candidate division Zixibacteria bacterium]|nr:hypothetical protein [candidate division Zixibacteria bacterium]